MLSRKPLETSPRLRGLVLLLLICCFPGARAGTAAVAMPDSYSTEVAQDVIDAGGNAVDAAVAAAIAEVEATSIRDMGKVMAALKGKYTGQMDFGKVGPMVKAKLG